MKQNIYLLLILVACETTKPNKAETDAPSAKIDSATSVQNNNSLNNTEAAADTSDYDNATYFIVVADTNPDYTILHKKMVGLSKKLTLRIDTMGRFYNKAKNLIALPDNDEDEMYAGNYYPRRFPSNDLSLEYLNFYQEQAGVKTIALVTGIYETEKEADSTLSVLKKTEKKVFKIKATIYVGCMH